MQCEPSAPAVRRQRHLLRPCSLFSPAQPMGVSENIQGCLLTQTSLKTTSAEMPSGASHGIPNPVRLTKNLAITSPPLGGKGTQLVGMGLEALRGCRSQCLQSQGAGQRSRETQPRTGHLSLCPLLYQAAPLHQEQSQLEGRLFIGQDKALLK